jgi:polysaccharide deacetylase family protein (PEP-CTERM system associated)
MTPGGVVNAMTVDVEDYFQVSAFDAVVPRKEWDQLESRVSANTDRVLALFADHGLTATFFVLGWVADRFPGIVARIGGLGHEIASHGYGHELIYTQTPAEFRADVRRAKSLLEEASGRAVDGYRAPSFSITTRSLWALDVLIEEGHRYDASIFPIRHDRYGIPSSPRHPYVLKREAGSLVECPGSTARVGPLNLPVAGGGYFRLLPYAWTRWGVARLNRQERQPAIFYLHPWEVDPGQPRLAAPWLSRFRHYRNLDQTESRLRRLLEDFRFGPLRDVVAAICTGASRRPGLRQERSA